MHLILNANFRDGCVQMEYSRSKFSFNYGGTTKMTKVLHGVLITEKLLANNARATLNQPAIHHPQRKSP